MISRDQMQAAIDAGGVVSIGNKYYGKGTPLPSEAELAILSGEPAKAAEAEASIAAKVAVLEAELAKLKARPHAPAPAPEPAPAPAVAPVAHKPEPKGK